MSRVLRSPTELALGSLCAIDFVSIDMLRQRSIQIIRSNC